MFPILNSLSVFPALGNRFGPFPRAAAEECFGEDDAHSGLGVGTIVLEGEGLRLTTGAELKQLPTLAIHTPHPGFPIFKSRDTASAKRRRLGLWSANVGPVEARLRLHRDYSIKIMLAWETCCRSILLQSTLPHEILPLS